MTYTTLMLALVTIVGLSLPTHAQPDRRCGDFDGDNDVDDVDRNIQLHYWTGALRRGDPLAVKRFDEGDCDADGDVDAVDQVGWIQNATIHFQAGNLMDGDDADLVYDPATGNVTLDSSDTVSGRIVGFAFANRDRFRLENLDNSADGSPGPFFDIGINTDTESFQIGQTDVTFQGVGPVIDLGDIFPPGIMSVAELQNYLTIAQYASWLGVGGEFDLIVVPEPSSMFLCLWIVMAFRRRR